jgi:multidrug efflux pump subunit AcrA (membrane-fusion protein)
MKRKLIIIGVGLAIIIAGYVLSQALAGMEENPPSMVEATDGKYAKSVRVEYGDYPTELTAYGRLKARDKIEIFSEVTGAVLRSDPEFEEGVYFAKGDAMLKIDAEESRLNLYSQKSDFLNILTSIMPDIKSDFPASYTAWKEYLEQYEIKEPIREIPEADSPKEKYFLASRMVYKTFYAIKNMELRLSKHIIRAPFDGYVTLSFAEPGALVRTGQKLGEFTATGVYELRLPVATDHAGFINPGNKVAAGAEGLPRTIEGRVVRINRSIDPNTQTVNIYARLSGQGLKDGMYMKTRISGARLDSVFRIPRHALINNNYIYIIRDSSLTREAIEVIRMGETAAYIRGLRPGATAVVEPLVGATPGIKVIPVFE